MDTYKLIDLNEYVQTGEGGTSLIYTHQTRHTIPDCPKMLCSNCQRSSDKNIIEDTNGKTVFF